MAIISRVWTSSCSNALAYHILDEGSVSSRTADDLELREQLLSCDGLLI